jgi:hypothetical protein
MSFEMGPEPTLAPTSEAVDTCAVVLPPFITIERVPMRQPPRRPRDSLVFLEGENQRPPVLDLQEKSRNDTLGAVISGTRP